MATLLLEGGQVNAITTPRILAKLRPPASRAADVKTKLDRAAVLQALEEAEEDPD